VAKTESGHIQMNFPNTKPKKVDTVPDSLMSGLSIPPAEVYVNSQAYFVVYECESDVLSVLRNNESLARLKPLDVVVTCKSETEHYDFVSRYFWPANGGDEDPVTGSIHTGLAPFWAERLGKNNLVAYQASKRGGVLNCVVSGDRVFVSGNAVHYLSGTITV
jgi:predicted PhzF superfamily epimerase YddE/YHI9